MSVADKFCVSTSVYTGTSPVRPRSLILPTSCKSVRLRRAAELSAIGKVVLFSLKMASRRGAMYIASPWTV